MSRKWTRIALGLVTVIIAASMLAFSCAPAEEPSEEKPPVKIGMTTPLTGDLEFVGAGKLASAEIARDEINEAGGILGGRMIEIIAYDDKCTADLAVSNATRLIYEDKVVAITGEPDNTPCFAIADMVKEADLIHSCDICHWLGPSPEYPMVHTFPKPYQAVGPYWKYMLEREPQAKSVVLVGPDVLWTTMYHQALQMANEKQGSQIDLNVVRFPIFTPDASSYVAEALSYHPDLITSTTWDVPGQAKEITALIEQGFDVGHKFYGSYYGYPVPPVVAALGEDAEGIIGAYSWVPGYKYDHTSVDFDWPAEWEGKGCDNPQNKRYVEEFMRRMGHTPYFLQQASYTDVMYIAKAIDYVGRTGAPAEEYIAALSELDWENIEGGPVAVSEWGQITSPYTYIVGVVNGKCTVVDMVEIGPEDIATPEEYEPLLEKL